MPLGPETSGGSIAHLRELVEGWHNPFGPGRISDFNAPDGLQIRWGLNLSSFSSTIVLYGLAALFGANAAFGLFTLGGLIGSGLAMFLLARKLTGSAWIGLIVGWAFGFYPFAVVNGEHPHFVHGWVFVVLAWRMFELVESPTLRNGVFAGLAGVLVFSWTQYFILLGGVCFAALSVGALVVSAFRGGLRRQLVGLLPAFGLVGAFGLGARALVQASGDVSTIPGNTLPDIINTSAHLGMYLVPAAFTPIAGDWASGYLNERLWVAVEWTLYVGWSILALAAVALAMALARRLSSRQGAVVLISSVVVLAGFVFSLPPQTEVAGHTIRLPSSLVFEVASGWRLYTRFVIVVMLGLCLLAAIGLDALTRGRGRLGLATLAAATLVVPLDLWNRVPDMTYRVRRPTGVLGGSGGTRVRGFSRSTRSGRCFPRGTTTTCTSKTSTAARSSTAISAGQANSVHLPSAGSTIRARRVGWPPSACGMCSSSTRHVIPGLPDPGAVDKKGFRFITADYYAALFRVTAKPAPFVYSRSGLEPPEGKRNPHRWASSPTIDLEVIAPCNTCRGRLRFTAVSLRAAPAPIRYRPGRQRATRHGDQAFSNGGRDSAPVPASDRAQAGDDPGAGPDLGGGPETGQHQVHGSALRGSTRRLKAQWHRDLNAHASGVGDPSRFLNGLRPRVCAQRELRSPAEDDEDRNCRWCGADSAT